MRVIGLTGGIGSGKSTVGVLLAEAGADVIDADLIAREVVEPGQPALNQIAEEFGPEVITPDGELDRAAMARIVFNDRDRRLALELITHPRIAERIGERLRRLAIDEVRDARDRWAVVEHPLLVETGQGSHYEALLVVMAPEDVRLARLVERGLDEGDARARIAAQATDEQRREAATHLIDNSGTLADLASAVDAVLEDLGVPR